MGFTLVGLVLKCVYYRYLHIWAWLIMDYVAEKSESDRQDGHWMCTLKSNMFFMGDLKERTLLLCCIPRPMFKPLNFLFGERWFKTTNTNCSRCSCVFGILLIPVAFALALGNNFCFISYN